MFKSTNYQQHLKTLLHKFDRVSHLGWLCCDRALFPSCLAIWAFSQSHSLSSCFWLLDRDHLRLLARGLSECSVLPLTAFGWSQASAGISGFALVKQALSSYLRRFTTSNSKNCYIGNIGCLTYVHRQLLFIWNVRTLQVLHNQLHTIAILILVDVDEFFIL